ncbi:EamA family transporter [bacterium]|nr:EamA family transporter [bacterium]
MGRVGANARQAIMLNYAVAALTGFIFFRGESDYLSEAWFWPAGIMGIMFYVVFRLIAKTTQTNGVSAASIATKMSVIIPIAVGLLMLGETWNVLKLTGIAVGIIAVILSTGSNPEIKDWKWPLLAFIGSGVIDASLNLFQVWTVSEAQFPSFISTIFSFAFVTGIIHHFTFSERKISIKTYLGGAALGIVNFGSLLFILLSLSLPNFESSVIFPINNVGIVMLSSIMAFLLFKEKITLKALLGILLSIVAIALLYFSN